MRLSLLIEHAEQWQLTSTLEPTSVSYSTFSQRGLHAEEQRRILQSHGAACPCECELMGQQQKQLLFAWSRLDRFVAIGLMDPARMNDAFSDQLRRQC